jgi:pimeloyl-ACP methyl ester carboxylesterase
MSGDAWQDTAPLLAVHHEVYTPSALGHRAGPPVERRPVTIWDVIDASEHYLDEKRLDRPHLAGHSLGGFVALELARRGRAASVCVFSPGGFWTDELRTQNMKKVRRRVAVGRAVRPITPLLMKSPSLRRLALRDATLHGDRLSADRAVEIAEEPFECTIINDVFNNVDEHVAPMDPLPCPVTIAWAEKDTVLPLELCESIARDCLPRAIFIVLPDVAHVPMLDDPQLVARTILAVTGAAT